MAGSSSNQDLRNSNHEAHGTLKKCCCTAERQFDTHCADPISCVPLIRRGNGDFSVFTEGDDLYAAMLTAIAAARETVFLETYIFADDEIGRRFTEALANKASQGVRVRVLIDAAGSLFWASRRLEKSLRQQGVQLKWYHRWLWRHPLRYDQRNHRKLLVVDNAQAFLGGFNIHHENSRSIYGELRWRDTHLQMGEELAVEAARQFDAVWHGRRDFMDARLEGVSAMVVSNTFRNCRRRFRCLYTDRITAAKENAYLTTPYFVPDWQTLRCLASAARRGICACFCRERAMSRSCNGRPMPSMRVCWKRECGFTSSARDRCTPRPPLSTGNGRSSAHQTSTTAASVSITRSIWLHATPISLAS